MSNLLYYNFMYDKLKLDEQEKAVIVYVHGPSVTKPEIEYSLEEAKMLCETLGLKVIEYFIQKRDRPDLTYCVGKGKLEEIRLFVEANDVEVIVFNNDISGIQEKNLEKLFQKLIMGRTEVILNIFQRRARTNQAKLQVELAFQEYMMPRLKNRWSHFSRVEGGIGLRGGEGEKQIELDKRMIKEQIRLIKLKLKKVDTQMHTQRKRRLDTSVVSIVGYTNAGKTTLLNMLSGASLFSEDMLFATLDVYIRKVYINDNLTILMSDTVGFIDKLPHGLVASFKSTLEEVKNSSLLLHVVDASSTMINKNIASVNAVLKEIGADDIPTFMVYNKIDKLENGVSEVIVNSGTNKNIFISARNKTGLEELKIQIRNFFNN